MREAFYGNITEYFTHVQTVCTRPLLGVGGGEEEELEALGMRLVVSVCMWGGGWGGWGGVGGRGGGVLGALGMRLVVSVLEI